MAFVFLLLISTSLFAQTFTLHSDQIGGQLTNKQVFNGFGCTGENISPTISWSNAPKDTKSFAITLYDPDAPTGSGWWHWVVFDIPSSTNNLVENAGNAKMGLMPKGAIQSLTDFGGDGFGGACPPVGDKDHQYIFTVHALSVASLGLDAKANPALVGYYINSKAIAKASIVSYFGR